MITLSQKELQDLYLYIETVPMKFAMPIFQFLKTKEKEVIDAMQEKIKKESETVVETETEKTT